MEELKMLNIIVNFVIKKASDDSLVTSGSMTDSGNGIYTSSYNFNVLGQFYVIYTSLLNNR